MAAGVDDNQTVIDVSIETRPQDLQAMAVDGELQV